MERYCLNVLSKRTQIILMTILWTFSVLPPTPTTAPLFRSIASHVTQLSEESYF